MCLGLIKGNLHSLGDRRDGAWKGRRVFRLSVAHQKFRRKIGEVFRGISLTKLRVFLEEQENSWGEVWVVVI